MLKHVDLAGECIRTNVRKHHGASCVVRSFLTWCRFILGESASDTAEELNNSKPSSQILIWCD